MSHNKYTHFIKEKAEVAESSKTKSFAKGERREDYEAMWQQTGTLLLVGLPGSGRTELGRLLAARLDMPFVQASDACSLDSALENGPGVVVLADALFDEPELIAKINRAGKVFYLMADARTLAQRVAERSEQADLEQVWRSTSARLEEVEPRFMQALHFILQAQNAPEALLEDAVEKVSW